MIRDLPLSSSQVSRVWWLAYVQLYDAAKGGQDEFECCAAGQNIVFVWTGQHAFEAWQHGLAKFQIPDRLIPAEGSEELEEDVPAA